MRKERKKSKITRDGDVIFSPVTPLKPCLHCTQNQSRLNPDRISIGSIWIGCGYVASTLQNILRYNT